MFCIFLQFAINFFSNKYNAPLSQKYKQKGGSVIFAVGRYVFSWLPYAFEWLRQQDRFLWQT